MIKKETIEIQVYYCDNCGAKISTTIGKEIQTYTSTDGEQVHLCDDCLYNVPVCDECDRVGLSDNDLFSTSRICEGSFLCANCLSDEILSVKKALSAAEAFLQRHKVE